MQSWESWAGSDGSHPIQKCPNGACAKEYVEKMKCVCHRNEMMMHKTI